MTKTTGTNLLAAGSYVGVGLLTQAFSAAVANPAISREQILQDMTHVVQALRDTDQPQVDKLADRLQGAADDARPDALRKREHGITQFLKSIPKSTLIEAGRLLNAKGLLQGAERFAEFKKVSRGAAGPLGAEAGAALQTRVVADQYDISIGGEAYTMPPQLVSIAPRVEDVDKRFPVIVPADVQQRAADNMNDAIARYFGDQIYQMHTEYLPAHVRAISDGELAAPREIREEIVRYVATSPEHAEAYGIKVLQDAMLGDVLRDPLPVIVDLTGLQPREARPPEAERKEAAEILFASINTLDRDQWRLYQLIHSEEGVVKQLAEENPQAFGKEKIMGIINAAQVLLNARRVSGAKATAVYLYAAQQAGMIPEGFITFGKDPKLIRVKMPAGSPRKDAGWEQPLAAHMESEEFAENVAAKPVESKDFDFAFWLHELGSQNQQVGFSLEMLNAEILKGHYDTARKGYLFARLNRMRKKMAWLTDNGLHQMDGLRGQVRAQLDAGRFPQAEALVDFAEQWVRAAASYIMKRDEYEAMMFIIGERKAAAAFRETFDELLKIGDVDGMRALVSTMKKATEGREVTLKSRQSTLSNRIVTTVAMTFETIRSLAAIPGSEARAPIAARVPPIDYFMKTGTPNTPERARVSLSARGIPLPGDEGVPALTASGIRGYDMPALPAPAKESLGAAADEPDEG